MGGSPNFAAEQRNPDVDCLSLRSSVCGLEYMQQIIAMSTPRK